MHSQRRHHDILHRSKKVHCIDPKLRISSNKCALRWVLKKLRLPAKQNNQLSSTVDSEDNDEDVDILNIETNMPEHFDADEHGAVQFAAGTDTPPPVRPFRRSPLSEFTIRRFDLAGFDEPARLHEHRMDPPVNLELFYGVDDDDSSITTFSTNDGNSNRGDDIDDDNDSVINADDDGEFVPPEFTDGGAIDDEDDDCDDDDGDGGSGVIALEDEF